VTIPFDLQAPGLARTVVVRCLAEHAGVGRLLGESTRAQRTERGGTLPGGVVQSRSWMGPGRLESKTRAGGAAPQTAEAARKALASLNGSLHDEPVEIDSDSA